MLAARRIEPAAWRRSLPRAATRYAPAALVAYFVLLGGTDAAVTSTPLRTVNAVIGGVLIAICARRIRRDHDALDLCVLLALIAFLATGVVSRYPRQSFDAALAATAYAAAFYLARRALADPAARHAVIVVLAVLGAALGAAFTLFWGATWVDWGILSDWVAWPPVDLRLLSGPFRHPQVVGMLMALLLPALVMLCAAGSRRLAAVGAVAIVLCAAVIFISGSRTTWLAISVAGVAVLALIARRGVGQALRRRRALVALGAAAAVGVVAVVWWTGAGDALLMRVADTATLGGRGRMWAGALAIWSGSPLAGAGPGSFPMALSHSSYYQVMGFPPRHADNAVVQLLAEGGLVALLGLLIAGAAWTRRALRASNLVAGLAVGGVVFVAVASMADNPSDSANLIVLFIVWAAVAAVTRPQATATRRAQPARWPRFAERAAVAVVILAVATTTAASAAFDAARVNLAAGDEVASLRALDVAARLDPAMALYVRERGVLELSRGDLEAAARDLHRALALNAADDTALRGLSIAASMSGEQAQALEFAEAAVALQDAETVNHLLLVWIAARAQDDATVRAELTESIVQAPWITAGPDWVDPFPSGPTLQALVDEAAEAAIRAARHTANLDVQPTWLAAMSARRDLRADAQRAAPALRGATSALLDVFDCDTEAALETLDAAYPVEGHTSPYWSALILALRAAGMDDERALRLATFRSNESIGPPGSAEPLLPLSDGSQDFRFYRREALPASDVGVRLPAPAQGLSEWLWDPRQTAARAAPDAALASCR